MPKELTPADIVRRQMSRNRLSHMPMPTTSQGVPSVRAYRSIGDYFIELTLHGRMSARDASSMIGALHKQAELLAAEKTLALTTAEGDRQIDHPLGPNGGLATLSPEIDIDPEQVEASDHEDRDTDDDLSSPASQWRSADGKTQEEAFQDAVVDSVKKPKK